jgi:hypothetical protein
MTSIRSWRWRLHFCSCTYTLYTCKYDVLITVYVELEISYNASVPENSISSQLLICLLGAIDSGLVRKRLLSQIAFILVNLAYHLGQGFPVNVHF